VTITDFTVPASSGEPVSLDSYTGQVLLIVNTASRCGFTHQLAGLQELWEQYRDRGFTVIGFPCNQFGHQDPGTDEEIQEFCRLDYGVTFPVMAKVQVNGSDADPLFTWLTTQVPGLMGTKAIKWNFTKFLVGRDGQVIARFRPTDEPAMLARAIEDALAVDRTTELSGVDH
jgi:glutathione peroxidase